MKKRLLAFHTYFMLLLGHYFPHIKCYPNRMKNTHVENFCYWSILDGWAGRSKNGHRYLKLILCCFFPIISPHTIFHPNWMKNTEVENSRQFVDFGRLGR